MCMQDLVAMTIQQQEKNYFTQLVVMRKSWKRITADSISNMIIITTLTNTAKYCLSHGAQLLIYCVEGDGLKTEICLKYYCRHQRKWSSGYFCLSNCYIQ
mmetsp:Transcript_24059/g.49845  ORF Transcript_24059/g.49845 Transcript_24059/m.49845 type:complete len:100 (+) Transcript_24059:228-527(+)